MFDNVLVGVDGLSGGRDAIALARLLAGPGARVTLAHVYGRGGALGRFMARDNAAERAEAEALLATERQAARIGAAIILRHHAQPGECLREIAAELSADLLVLGSSHRGTVGRVLLGDATITALDGAMCATTIAPSGYAEHEHHLRRIGVGSDASAESEAAVDIARGLAARAGATIQLRAVVTLQEVAPGPPYPLDWTAETDRIMCEEKRRLDALEDVEGEVVYGDPGEELAKLAPRVDLLVVGSRSQGPIGRLMSGSTSTYLARRVGCPLLVVPRALTAPAQLSPDEPSRDLHAPAAPTS